MSLPLKVLRVKEKIRYDINIHREENKQILLNSRRGVIVREEDKNDVFTLEDMHKLALKIKRRKQISVKHLKILKHALLSGQEFILKFYQVQGAVDSLLHFVSSKNEGIQLAAIECFCNMALGDKKTCIKLAKLVTPYLMIYMNNLNFNLSSMSIWTLGNISDSSKDSCKLLQNQNVFGALVDCLKNSTCDEVTLNTFYALKLFLKTDLYNLKIEDLQKLLLLCFERLNSWNESFWIVYQISCRQDCAFIDKHFVKNLFNHINTDVEEIDFKCLVAILRTLSNVIAIDNTGHSANEFIFWLRNKGNYIRYNLIRNANYNLNDECAWLLGNVFNVLKITENNCCFTTEDVDLIFHYLFI